MDIVLHALQFAYVYIDDVLVASFDEYRVFINPDKCEFGQSSLHSLGHIVNENGIRPLESKVSAVTDFPLPQSQCQVRQSLGLINFYYRFMPHSSQTLELLYSLLFSTPAHSPFSWTDDLVNVFHKAKSALAKATLL
uniref:Reverse transcriptase domain-containing protein n=1 Tax=Amphimedon queenslandica TaxID=400682 RepID=A0A1X7VHI9_AMPQE